MPSTAGTNRGLHPDPDGFLRIGACWIPARLGNLSDLKGP